MVALVREFHAVSYANDLAIHVEQRRTQNVLSRHARGLEVGRGRQLVPLSRGGLEGGAHARLLAFRKHPTAVAVLHVVLDVVQRTAGRSVEHACGPA